MHNYDGNIFGMHFYWWLFFIIIVVGVLIYNNSSLNKNKNSNRYLEKETALDVLEKRFARGEISIVEYEERKDVLEEKNYIKT